MASSQRKARALRKKTKVRDNDFEFIGEGGIDERKRLSLSKALAKIEPYLAAPATLEALHFRVYVNTAGQILLEPAVTVPLREMWLYRSPGALAKVREGLAEAAEGDLSDLGTFAEFADDEIE